MAPDPLAALSDGLQPFQPHTQCRRHRHDHAYAAVVIAGGYVEAGESGRYRVAAGDVILHGAFDAHQNSFGPGASVVLNVRLPAILELPLVLGRVPDLDRIARLAERKNDAVVQALLDEIEPAGDRAMADWPDLLANELRAGMKTPISVWAKKHGLTRESVSRGFRRVYGVSPVRFRAEVRARAAWYMLVSTRNPLSALSLQSGFCDQSHMTRAVHRMTGRSPGEWRRINWFKTAHPHTD